MPTKPELQKAFEQFRIYLNTADRYKDFDDLWNAIDALGDIVERMAQSDAD
jgi:hypothetical protein